MLQSGVPPLVAVRYFFPELEDEDTLLRLARSWGLHTYVQEEVRKYQGGSWQDLPPQERLKIALDKHYQEMAYFLYANNAAEMEGMRLTKSQTFRQALEAKLAGNAGKEDAMSRFMDDVLMGRIKVGAQVASRPN